MPHLDASEFSIDEIARINFSGWGAYLFDVSGLHRGEVVSLEKRHGTLHFKVRNNRLETFDAASGAWLNLKTGCYSIDVFQWKFFVRKLEDTYRFKIEQVGQLWLVPTHIQFEVTGWLIANPLSPHLVRREKAA